VATKQPELVSLLVTTSAC